MKLGKHSTAHAPSKARGFTLVELMAVMCVLGLFASIALPQMTNINDNSTKVTAQRNAQSIVEIFQSGSASGACFYKAAKGHTGSVRDLLILGVVNGATPTDGPFSGQVFRLPKLTTTDIIAASAYITCDSGSTKLDSANLNYAKNGGQVAFTGM